MNFFGVIFLIIGIIIIAYPPVIAYMVGGVFVFLGCNILLARFLYFRGKKNSNYVKFGNYKIYKD